MIKKLKPILLTLLTAASLTAMFVGSSRAADHSIVCNSLGCSGPGTALFTETNITPGDSVTKSLEVKNERSENLTIELKAEKKSGTDEVFIKKVDVSVDEVAGANKFSGTMETFLDNVTSIPLGTLSASSAKEYEITLGLQDVDNFYQGKGANFNIAVNVTGEAGQVSGASVSGPVSAPGCSATSPSSAPTLLAIPQADNTVLLTWSSVSPVTHYMIQFGYSSGNYIFGASDVGDTTVFTVTELSGATTYFFQVAGVNDCAPGPWSNESSATPPGAVLGLGFPAGFTQILGEATESAQEPEEEPSWTINQSGQVLSESGCQTQIPWWVPLLIQLILTILLVMITRDSRLRNRVFLTILFIGLVSELTHVYFGCPCDKGSWCQWYGVMNILIIAMGLLLRSKLESNDNPVFQF
jgi:hypothetical protein